MTQPTDPADPGVVSAQAQSPSDATSSAASAPGQTASVPASTRRRFLGGAALGA
ncbi:MAG: hypothetical protein M3Y77_21405 [Actinomycetota bacterium]|nr:hypothetical protein [Actinomycetota bacterium]